jgi:hypothetical protein
VKIELNCKTQYYKGLPLNLIKRIDYPHRQAKRFTMNFTGQNVWIPNKHLHPNGTIKEGENLDYVFAVAERKLELAGYMMGFIPVKQPERQQPTPPSQSQYNRTHPSYQRRDEEESEHPEINNMDDYFTHYGDEQF